MIRHLRHHLCFCLVAGSMCLACGPTIPDPQVRPTGGLIILCEPNDALIYVDDKYLGKVAGLKQHPLILPEGYHRLEIRQEGYFAHYAEVTIVKGVRQKVKVKLRKEPY